MAGMGSPVTKQNNLASYHKIQFFALPLLLAMISSQDAKVESAMASGRGKVAFEGDKVGCSASLDGEVAGEALFNQSIYCTLRQKMFYVYCQESHAVEKICNQRPVCPCSTT